MPWCPGDLGCFGLSHSCLRCLTAVSSDSSGLSLLVWHSPAPQFPLPPGEVDLGTQGALLLVWPGRTSPAPHPFWARVIMHLDPNSPLHHLLDVFVHPLCILSCTCMHPSSPGHPSLCAHTGASTCTHPRLSSAARPSSRTAAAEGHRAAPAAPPCQAPAASCSPFYPPAPFHPVQLYNEEILDLFDSARDPDARHRKSNIKIHEDASGSIYTTGVTSRLISSQDEVGSAPGGLQKGGRSQGCSTRGARRGGIGAEQPQGGAGGRSGLAGARWAAGGCCPKSLKGCSKGFVSSLPCVLAADPVPEAGGSVPHHCQHPDERAELPLPRHLHHPPVPDEGLRPPGAGEKRGPGESVPPPPALCGVPGKGQGLEVSQRAGFLFCFSPVITIINI